MAPYCVIHPQEYPAHMYVPEQFRRKVFNSLHSLSRPSIKGTQHLVTAHFVWWGINANVCQ